MAKNKVINTVLTVQDKLSGGLVKAAQNAKKSGKTIDNSMIAATRSVVAFKNKSVKALTDAAKSGFESFAGTVRKTALAVTASATAAATGLTALTLKSALAADDLNTMAKQSGFSTADIQKWQYASDLIDVSIDDIVKSAGKMKKNMISTSKTTIAAWDQLGVKVEDGNGQLRDSTTVFYETLTALSKVQNETERDTLAMTIFGKSADSLAGIVDDGGAALQELADKAEKAGVILSQDTLDGANALNDKVDTLKATVKGFAGKVGSELAGRASKALDVVGSHFSKAFNVKPMEWMNSKLDGLMSAIDGWISSGGLDAFADKLVTGVQTAAQKAGEWLDKLKDWIANGGLTELADKLSSAIPKAAELAQGGIDLLSDALDKAKDAMQFCKDHSEELKTVVGLLGIAFGMVKLSQFNTGLTDAISNIGGCIKTIGTMIGVTGAQTAATGGATAAQTGLNAAMAANPIGFWIIVIEAAIAAGVLLYKNWDKLKSGAQKLWKKFEDVSVKIWNAFGGAFDKIKNAAKSALEWVGDKLKWLSDKIESIPILGSLYKGAKDNVVSTIEKVSYATSHWDGRTSSGNSTTTKTTTTSDAGPVATKSTLTTTTVPKPSFTGVPGLPGFAGGTPYFRGGFARVNERGGEIMNLPSGTQIIPHDVSVKAAGGRGVTVNINIQGNLIGNREYTEQVGEYVGRKVLAALGNT